MQFSEKCDNIALIHPIKQQISYREVTVFLGKIKFLECTLKMGDFKFIIFVFIKLYQYNHILSLNKSELNLFRANCDHWLSKIQN